jgi:hypothetical protein
MAGLLSISRQLPQPAPAADWTTRNNTTERNTILERYRLNVCKALWGTASMSHANRKAE